MALVNQILSNPAALTDIIIGYFGFAFAAAAVYILLINFRTK